jgi:hypothetical protein
MATTNFTWHIPLAAIENDAWHTVHYASLKLLANLVNQDEKRFFGQPVS